jgi:hypothetical protein
VSRKIVLVFYGQYPETIKLLKATKFQRRELKLRADWSQFTQYRTFLFTTQQPKLFQNQDHAPSDDRQQVEGWIMLEIAHVAHEQAPTIVHLCGAPLLLPALVVAKRYLEGAEEDGFREHPNSAAHRRARHVCPDHGPAGPHLPEPPA